MFTRTLLTAVFSSALFLALSTTVAFAQYRVNEADLPALYDSEIIPNFNAGTGITYVGELGKKLHAYQFIKGSTAVVIAPGWGEPARKYAEVVYDLNQAGYSVFVLDHRGQGESERIIDCPCSYVESFRYYVKDLAGFIDTIVKPQHFNKVFLLGHSMGGGIVAQTLLVFPSLVDGAILSSPMLQIITDPYPEVVAQSLTKAMVTIGKGKERRLFDKDKPEDFNTNIGTHSLTRWTISHQLMTDMPQLKTGWASNQWLNEMFEMTKSIRATPAKKMKTPVLLLQSSDDKYVVNATENKLCSNWSNCTLVQIPNTKHEILMESDAARNEAFRLITNFLR